MEAGGFDGLQFQNEWLHVFAQPEGIIRGFALGDEQNKIRDSHIHIADTMREDFGFVVSQQNNRHYFTATTLRRRPIFDNIESGTRF